jgi:hypothetical protein
MPDQYLYALSDTWNSGATTFTAIGMDVTDTASAAASLLIDLKVNGASRMNVRKDGLMTVGTLAITLLKIGGTDVTASAAELNILDGVTASTAELNYLDITTLGTSQASKVVTADANGDVKFSNAIVETVFALTGTTPALDPSNGTIQTWTLSGNSTPTDSLAAGESLTLLIDDGSAFSVTWPAVTWKTNSGTAPTLLATGFTVIVLWKVGTTLFGARVGGA